MTRSIGVAALGLALSMTAHAQSAVENYAFSVSWEPTFCLTHGAKPECQTESSQRWDASNLSLHGLWPQGAQYCGVSSEEQTLDRQGQWSSLPPVVLSPDTASLLQTEMPGTASDLERHEWIKHGTCSGYDQQTYFGEALALLGNVDASNLASTIAGNVGSTVQLSDLYQAASLDYGDQAYAGVEFLCTSFDGQQMLSEIRFHLAMPQPLPTTIQGANLVAPAQSTSESELCSDGDVQVTAAQ